VALPRHGRVEDPFTRWHHRNRRYNASVCAVSPPPDQRPRKLHIHKLEAGGILNIGALILLLPLARYWHHITWGAC
jgi:hypothetical protein